MEVMVPFEPTPQPNSSYCSQILELYFFFFFFIIMILLLMYTAQFIYFTSSLPIPFYEMKQMSST